MSYFEKQSFLKDHSKFEKEMAIIDPIREIQAGNQYEILKNGQIAKGEWPEGDIPILTYQDGWLSVNEQLPEEYTMVLIWDGDNIYRAEYVDGEWHGIPDNTGFFLDSITHWRPLPEGPKEEVSS
ncbi:hypothetical protein UF75_2221 [Desulfosporosinus sp. I2]|nr:hypothetical protein UF75_2221 [Desulfosporosinus sp. I2]